MSLSATKRGARRGKNLTDGAIEQIVRILDAWSDVTLTWEALIDSVALRLQCRYTRQALHKHERIRAAFAQRKSLLSAAQPRSRRGLGGPEGVKRMARLEAENQRLEAENQRLLEQFVTWAYNAHARGLTKEFLDQPLPRVNRGQTLSSRPIKKM